MEEYINSIISSVSMKNRVDEYLYSIVLIPQRENETTLGARAVKIRFTAKWGETSIILQVFV